MKCSLLQNYFLVIGIEENGINVIERVGIAKLQMVHLGNNYTTLCKLYIYYCVLQSCEQQRRNNIIKSY